MSKDDELLEHLDRALAYQLNQYAPIQDMAQSLEDKASSEKAIQRLLVHVDAVLKVAELASVQHKIEFSFRHEQFKHMNPINGRVIEGGQWNPHGYWDSSTAECAYTSWDEWENEAEIAATNEVPSESSK